MPTYYVRTTGNDSTGDGSISTPWLTISKAQASVSAGDIVLIGAGTYDENTAGAGFFNINRVFADWVEFRSESGVATDVVIRGASSATYNTLTNADNAKYRFRNVSFGSRLATNASAFRITRTQSMEFYGCRFTVPTDNASVRHAFYIATSGTNTALGVVLDTCVVDSGASSNLRGLATAVPVTGAFSLTLTGCTMSGKLPLQIVGPGNLVVSGGSYVGTAGYGIIIGVDGVTSTGTITGSVSNASISTATGTGHGLLIGAGCTDFLAEGNTVVGADYGIVVKECAGAIVSGNSVTGGRVNVTNGSAIYFKGATGATATGNTFVSERGTHGTVRIGVGNSGNKCGTVTLTDNNVISNGNSMALEWADSTGDSGGGVCDRNLYEALGTATLGNVRSTTGIETIAALRAAWSGYGDGTNDSASWCKVWKISFSVEI